MALNGFTATQKYYYDELNRIDDATEHVGTTQKWRQDFTYDRYGNRNFVQANTTVPASFANPAVSNPTISTTNNRITSTGWLYDSAGNTTRDGEYKTFTYDGENKQVVVKNSSNVTLGEYWYDGDGKRVKKKAYDSSGALTEETIFVHDAAGKQIAEYSTNVATIEDAQVAYLTNDHLGSPRINTDRDGDVTSRHDYHPFGEEILTTERGNHPEYSGDGVRRQFTGFERDGESDLDFAQARMYSNKSGRFTSSDPLLNSGRPNVPQSWNRYTYAGNSPFKFNDQSGLFEWDASLAEDSSLSKKENERRAGLRNRILAAYDKAKAEIIKATNAKKLSADKLAKLNNALDALGPKPGESGSNNGVTVGVGTVKGNVGETKPEFTFEQDLDGTHGGHSIAATISVKFDEDYINKSSGLFAGLVHEGSHVADMQVFASHPETIWNTNNPYNLSQYQSEVNAFQVNSYLFESMGANGSKFHIPVWNTGWAKVDKKLPPIEQNRSHAIDSYISSAYSLSSSNPGFKFTDYGVGTRQKK